MADASSPAIASNVSVRCVIRCRVRAYYVDPDETLKDSWDRVQPVIDKVGKHAGLASGKLLGIYQCVKVLWIGAEYQASPSHSLPSLIGFRFGSKRIKPIAVHHPMIHRELEHFDKHPRVRSIHCHYKFTGKRRQRTAVEDKVPQLPRIEDNSLPPAPPTPDASSAVPLASDSES
ncbi:hypothetical protein TPAR_03189 [Tolypocladium paradoxum]|uniref:Uncharacterized protein n=1 Tax=Tolypocladium paradoxum TaxID=94208 RepID=A0A2S4L2F4_9HYPO|nr:hypothetical protein TPAR_03189 [Tolypocladium paradoxum]